MKESSSKDIVYKNLSSIVRWTVVFSAEATIKQKKISQETMHNLHMLVSTTMQEVYHEHVAEKSKDLVNTLKNRELIYIDVSKKWDMDIFTYITQQYFNLCSKDIRTKYNAMIYASEPDFFDKEAWSDDKHFLREVEHYKTYPQRQEQGSDMMIWFMPLQSLRVLLMYSRQQDLNIFLDNINSITQEEMWALNCTLRGWLLIGSEQRIGLFINNMQGTRNFNQWENLPPDDGHDMKIVYI